MTEKEPAGRTGNSSDDTVAVMVLGGVVIGICAITAILVRALLTDPEFAIACGIMVGAPLSCWVVGKLSIFAWRTIA